MNCSIASLDVPLRRPMFESTILGELAAKPPNDILHSAHQQVEVLPGVPGDCQQDNRHALQPHAQPGDTVTRQDIYTPTEPQTDLYHSRVISSKPHPHRDCELANQEWEHHVQINHSALPLNDSALPLKDSALPLKDSALHLNDSSLPLKDSTIVSGSDAGHTNHPYSPRYIGPSQTGVEDLSESKAKHIGCCQQIAHSLSSSTFPHQSLQESDLCKGSGNGSTACVRKVSQLSNDSIPLTIADSALQDSVSISSAENYGVFSSPSYAATVDPTSTRPSPVVRTRLDPHTHSFEEIIPDLSAVRISENVSPEQNDSKCLSPWEEWMIEKTKKERQKKEKLRLEKLARKCHDEEARDKMAQKVQQAAWVHREWVEQKRLKHLAHQRQEHKRRIAEKTKEEQLKETSQTKARACYEKWYNEMEEQRRQHKEKIKEQAREKELRDVELRQQAQHAYKVWLKTLNCKKTYEELANLSKSRQTPEWGRSRWNY